MRRLTLGDDPAVVVAALRECGEPAAAVERAVAEILADVRARGDEAVRAHALRLDGLELPERYGLHQSELSAAWRAARPELRAALTLAAANIRAYHAHERPQPWRETLAQGQVVGQEIVPLAAAGLYVPGGLANYPSSVLMTAIPAQVAGVERVVVCSPPRAGGGVAAGVAAACELLGIGDLYPIGGAQAVAAMAFGTAVVPRCDVIVGPGNAYVTEAKRQVMGEVRIDGLAGPSEVLIVADAQGRPDWLAADLLAQAEHGSGAMAALLDVGGELGDRVVDAVAELSAELALPTDQIAIVTCRRPAGGARPGERVRPRAPRAARGRRGGAPASGAQRRRRLRRPAGRHGFRRLRGRHQPRAADRRLGALRPGSLGQRLRQARRHRRAQRERRGGSGRAGGHHRRRGGPALPRPFGRAAGPRRDGASRRRAA